MLKNKIGQKAKIIMALRPENVGLVVTPIQLLGFHKAGENLNISGEVYTCFITDTYWLVEAPAGVETLFGGARQAYIPDTWLKPLVENLAGVDTKKAEVT